MKAFVLVRNLVCFAAALMLTAGCSKTEPEKAPSKKQVVTEMNIQAADPDTKPDSDKK